MNVKISDIKDYGNLEKERVVIKVLADTNLGKYILCTTQELSDERISSKIQNVLWLPDQDIKSGDLVVVYTKAGEKGSRINKDGTTTYFYYWGRNSVLTEIKDCGVVLFETSWNYKKSCS